MHDTTVVHTLLLQTFFSFQIYHMYSNIYPDAVYFPLQAKQTDDHWHGHPEIYYAASLTAKRNLRSAQIHRIFLVNSAGQ